MEGEIGITDQTTTEKVSGGSPKESRISHYTQETGVDIMYGKKTWRPVQSVIDLVQNHLDANTTVYEKELLLLTGITEYKPSSTKQQEVISMLNKIKYATNPEDIDKTYAILTDILGPDTPSTETLQQQLQEIKYPLPHVRLKVTNNTQSQLVEYDHVKDLPPEWKVSGFRLDDSGSGFDYRLLGIMGASTKKESTGKRGGLGEGLKMSVTHLARSGATVRLLSRNDDQLWCAKPKIQDDTVIFKGISRQEATPKATGSLTDVDFSNPNFDPKLRKEIVEVLDPREGEGLGKYILEFRDPQFESVINSSTEVSSRGVPRGRIYVKGLLVAEQENLLWSYNLKEKWAISGRDRKTVQRDILADSIREVIETLDNPDQINSLVRALATTCLEIQALDENLQLNNDQKELWRQAVEQTFRFSPGQQLFVPNSLSSEQRRLIEQRGFDVISLSPESMNALKLFETLYPDQIISFAQFQRNREDSKKSPHTASNSTREEIQIKDPPVSPEVAEILDRYKNEFTLMLGKTVLKQFKRGYGIPDILERLPGVRFAKASSSTRFELDSPFEYNATKNILYLQEATFKEDFATLTDMYVQLIKAATGKDTFDVQSQELLTQMASEAVASLRPELLTEFKLSGFNEKFTVERPITYSAEQHAKDDKLIAFFKHLELINNPNITKEELERVLIDMRAAKPSNLSGGKIQENAGTIRNIQGSHINSLFYYEGTLYSLNTYSLELHEVKFGGKEHPKFSNSEYKEPEKKLLNPNEPSHQLNGREWAYLPFQLHDQESMRLSFTEGDREAQVILKRRGNRIIATKVVDDKVGLLQLREFEHLYEQHTGTEINIYNNVLLIRPNESGIVTVDQNEVGSTNQLEETNRGKEFISSNITVDYGGEVWRDPKRILLDAIQNHIDARRDLVPQISYTVASIEGNVLRVSKNELQSMGNEWNIVGIEISDQGIGYQTPYLTKLGSSTKGDEDLGKFGEGLKMLAASAVRQGILVEIGSSNWVAEPTSFQQTVKDYETGEDQTFNMLGYNMKWKDQSRIGSQTHFSLLSLEPGQEQLTHKQMTQLQTNLSQEIATGKIWKGWTEVLDPRQINQFGQRGLDRYVLREEEQPHTNGTVDLLMDHTGMVYEKGLLILDDISHPMIFGYNLDETIIDTRERNTFNQKIFDGHVSEYFKYLTDTEVMRKVLEMARQNPGINFYEYKFLSSNFYDASINTRALWRQTYHDVFGDDVILSLRPELQRLNRYSTNDKGPNIYRDRIAHAVANEVHLETHNLKTLPEPLTTFFSLEVYTSQNFSEESESSEIELSPEDKAKLDKFVKTANQMILTALESLDSSPDKRQYLDRIVSQEHLRTRKEYLQRMLTENIRIKNPSFPALGLVEIQDNQAVIYLNQNILSDPHLLLETYVHEVAHYLSGQGDYVLGFQKFLMAIATNRSIPPGI
jgi:hypothetical protein